MHPAIQQAVDAADVLWKEDVLAAIRRTALRLPILNVDDVWDEMVSSKHVTHDKRAVGGLLKRAQREGLIQTTGQTRSTRPAKRSRSKSCVWESKVYKQN